MLALDEIELVADEWTEIPSTQGWVTILADRTDFRYAVAASQPSADHKGIVVNGGVNVAATNGLLVWGRSLTAKTVVGYTPH